MRVIMELGNRNRFAIQWDLDLQNCGRLLFGRTCYWVNGTMIGDFELGASLSDVLVSLSYPVGDSGDRDSDRFCPMTGEDAFALVHRGIFESDEAIAREVDHERWARFNISLPVDVFDGYRMYLFDCHSESRLLVGIRKPDRQQYEFLFEQRLSRGEFDEVIRSFQAELAAAARICRST